MKLLANLLRISNHVKPLGRGPFAAVLVTLRQPAWLSFFDDWRRYGLEIACSNLMEMLS